MATEMLTVKTATGRMRRSCRITSERNRSLQRGSWQAAAHQDTTSLAHYCPRKGCRIR